MRIVIVVFLTFASFASVFSDEAFDFYVEACRHSGYNPAEISTFQAEFRMIAKTTLPDSEIESLVKSLSDTLAANLVKMGVPNNPGDQQSMEMALEAVKQRLSGETETSSIKAFVKNSASPVGLADAPAYFLVQVEDENGKRSSLTSVALEEQVGAIQIGEHMITVDNNRNSVMFHLEGRMQSPVVLRSMKLLLSDNGEDGFGFSDTGIAAYRKDCDVNQRTFALKGKEKYEGDHYASILEVYEKEQLLQRFWIDADRGYICPKEQVFSSSTGTVFLFSETVSENFVLDEQSQKWFPLSVIKTIGKEQEEKTRIPEQRTEISVVHGTLVLNQPIPDSVFSIAVPQGGRIDDARRADTDKITFFANQPGTLDFAIIEGKKSLNNVNWMTPKETRQYYPPPIEKASFSWTQIVLMVLGIIMIIWGLILHFPRKRSNQ